jgi:hypothetical protein
MNQKVEIFRGRVLCVLALLTVFLIAPSAGAQAAPVAPPAAATPPPPTPEQQEALRVMMAREPRASDVLRVSLRFYQVHPEVIDSLRTASRLRGLLPVASSIGTFNGLNNASASSQTITTPQDVISNQAGTGYSLAFALSWDLREVIFNPSELQAYALVGIEQDILLEVTRTYFMRRQLQVRLALRPPADIMTRSILELRVDEYSALLDGMTGGWFSRAMAEALRPPPPAR